MIKCEEDKKFPTLQEEEKKHSIIWGMFMSVTMESAVFMGKNHQNNCHFIVNTTDLTLKQMFDISTRLVSEQDEISGLETIGSENHSWKYLSLIGDERIINLRRTKVYVFSDSVLCLGKIHQNPESNEAWRKRIEWITSSQSYRDFDGISGEPTEFEWNIFPGFDTLQLYGKVKGLLSRLRRNTRKFHRKNSICQRSIFLVTRKTMKKNVWHTLMSYLCMQESLVQDNGNSLVPVPKRKLYSMKEDSPQRNLGQYRGIDAGGIRRKRMSNFPCNDSIVQRYSQKQRTWKNCRFILEPLKKQLRLFFA